MRLLSFLLLVDKRYRRLFFKYVLSPLLVPIRWLLDGSYQILFGRWDARSSAAREKRLEVELRESFRFLFESDRAAVVPNVNIPFPEPFDYATVTVATANVLIRVARGRDELNVDLARATNPNIWYDLGTVLAAVRGNERPVPRWGYDLREAAILIRDNLAELHEEFGSKDERVQRRLQEFERLDRASIREWEFQINSRLP